MAIIIAQILITNEIGVVRDKMITLDRLESFSHTDLKKLNNES